MITELLLWLGKPVATTDVSFLFHAASALQGRLF
jgi:hypothetical protein